MANQTRVQEQVEQILAGKIMKRLAKLGAAEEGTLGQSVAAVRVRHGNPSHGFANVHTTTKTIPGTVVAAVITKLGKLGMIRRISVAGEVFVARRDVPREKLLAAIKRSVSESRYAAYAASREGRRERYGARETSFEMIRVVPLDDDDATESAAHRSTVKGLMADGPDAMTYEGSVTSALDAEEIPPINREAIDVEPVARKSLSELAKRRIAYQEKIGQGPRNTSRARRRWLRTEDGRAWLAIREAGDTRLEADRAAFRS